MPQPSPHKRARAGVTRNTGFPSGSLDFSTRSAKDDDMTISRQALSL